jgi:hypothetical protein
MGVASVVGLLLTALDEGGSASVGAGLATGVVFLLGSRRLLQGLSMWNEEVERGRLTRERFERPASGAVNVGWGFEVVPLGPHQCSS